MFIQDLPSDVIRKIISAGQESINDIMLISYRWNTLSYEHLSNCRRLPSIKCFCWTKKHHLRPVLKLRVANEYRDYFGVGKWSIRTAEKMPLLDDTVEITSDKRLDASMSQSELQLSPLFGRCLRIEQLEFRIPDITQRSSMFEKVVNSLRAGAVVDELAFMNLKHFNRHSACAILNFIRRRSVQQLVFYTNRNFTSLFSKFPFFFFNATKVVQSVRICIIDTVPPNQTPADCVFYWGDMKKALVREWQVDVTVEYDSFRRLPEISLCLRLEASNRGKK